MPILWINPTLDSKKETNISGPDPMEITPSRNKTEPHRFPYVSEREAADTMAARGRHMAGTVLVME